MKKLDTPAGGETVNQADDQPALPEREREAKLAHGFPPPEVREARLRQPVVASWPLGGSRVPHPKGEAAELPQVEAHHWNPVELEDWEIDAAINRAKPGITQYLKIMDLLPKVDVARNRDFQRDFNGFSRVRQRPPDWYTAYFLFMEEGKKSKPSFDETLDHLWNAFARCEASFSSKLVATLDPTQPVWDTFVLQSLHIKRPGYGSKNRVAQAKNCIPGYPEVVRSVSELA